jgi:hypothetical protein
MATHQAAKVIDEYVRERKEPYPSEGRGPYLHVEIEADYDERLTGEQKTEILLQISHWMQEAVAILSFDKATAVTNKVRNQVPGQRWRNMTPEQREKVSTLSDDMDQS